MLATLAVVAVSLGLDNMAASIALGASGADARTRLRTGLVFGLFETGMPILGLLLGHGLAATLGHAARWIGAALLIGTGLYALVESAREGRPGGTVRASPAPASPAPARPGLARLLVTGAALSADNLAVGFALTALQVSLLAAVIVIGAVSVVMSLAGLELGARIGARLGAYGEAAGGLALIGVGIALAAGAL